MIYPSLGQLSGSNIDSIKTAPQSDLGRKAQQLAEAISRIPQSSAEAGKSENEPVDAEVVDKEE